MNVENIMLIIFGAPLIIALISIPLIITIKEKVNEKRFYRLLTKDLYFLDLYVNYKTEKQAYCKYQTTADSLLSKLRELVNPENEFLYTEKELYERRELANLCRIEYRRNDKLWQENEQKIDLLKQKITEICKQNKIDFNAI